MINTDDCWLWAGAQDDKGYGRMSQWIDSKTKRPFAHRASYETFVGPIPDKLVLDHLCRVPLCINPDHLEPVTMRENIIRGIGYAGLNTRKTHCPKGHEYSDSNTSRYGEKGWRRCRTCEVERSRLFYLKNRKGQPARRTTLNK